MKPDWRELTLREKIYQTAILSAGNFYGKDKDTIQAHLSEHPVGAVFVGPEVIQRECCNTDQVLEAMEAFQSASKVPLVFCADLETGCGTQMSTDGLTTYPDQMCLGATYDKDLAYEWGKGTAVEALKLGIQWSFSPVVDLNLNPFNAVTNVRSLGTDPDTVSELAVNIVKGMQEYGLAATAKHFPGDGVDFRDHHFVTSANTLPYEEWKQKHGKVFQSVIDAGVMAIMPGHISLPDYQKERVHGMALPATLSSELLTKLLREEMGFEGVLVSDALVMGGFRRTYDTVAEAEVACFAAGMDMMLWPSDEYVTALEKALLSGRVPMSRLEDALERIWAFKEKLGLFGERSYPVTEDDKQKAEAVAENVADRGVVLVRDRKGELPLKVKKVAIITISTNDGNSKKMQGLKALLEERGIEVKVFERQAPGQELMDCDKVIYAIYLRPHQPVGHVDFEGDNIFAVSDACRFLRDRAIVVNFGSPYLIDTYFEPCDIAINAFSNISVCHRAVVKGLLGEMEFEGKKNY